MAARDPAPTVVESAGVVLGAGFLSVRRALFLAGVLLSMPLYAQAPAEERQLPGDSIEASQRRLGVLRHEAQASEERLRQVELDAKEAGARLEEARARSGAAARALQAARQESAQARKSYEQESIAFERLRKGEPPAASGTKKPAAAEKP